MIHMNKGNGEMSGSILELMAESAFAVKEVAKMIMEKGPELVPNEVREKILKDYVDTLINLAYGDTPDDLMARMEEELKL